MTALAVTYASSQAALPPTQPPLALIPQIWWNIPSLTSVPLTYPHLHSPLTTYLNTSPPQQDVLTTSHTHLLPFPTQHLFPQQPTGSSPHVHTPVNTHLLACLLTGHPNSGFTTYLLQGLTQGFWVGYHNNHGPLPAPNIRSALACPQVIDTYLAAECQAGHTAGTFPVPPLPNFVVNPLGAIPKKRSGKWRLITVCCPRCATRG